jgi:hypothetical protein
VVFVQERVAVREVCELSDEEADLAEMIEAAAIRL